MEIKKLKYLILVIYLFYSCNKASNIFQDAVILQGKTTVNKKTDSLINFSFRYSVNSKAFQGKLLPPQFFSFDSTVYLFNGQSSALGIFKQKSISVVKPINSPASVFVLIDKSVRAKVDAVNKENVNAFKEGFFSAFSKPANLEFNFGMAASNNALVPPIYLSSTSFLTNLSDFPDERVTPLFNYGINGGKGNLAFSIDSVASYMARSSHFDQRYIIVFSDSSSSIDPASVDHISSICNANNIHIIMVCIYGNSKAQTSLVNKTNGYIIYPVSAEFSYDYKQSFETLSNIFRGQEVYEAQYELTTNSPFFSSIKDIFFYIILNYFNHRYAEISLYNEF